VLRVGQKRGYVKNSLHNFRSALQQVVLLNQHKFDFVPLNASDATTLKDLFQLRSVPGTIRSYTVPKPLPSKQHLHLDATSQRLLLRAQAYARAYANRDIHLVYNNCWTFALGMYKHLLMVDDNDQNTFE
jgi:hypothetical protein